MRIEQCYSSMTDAKWNTASLKIHGGKERKKLSAHCFFGSTLLSLGVEEKQIILQSFEELELNTV